MSMSSNLLRLLGIVVGLAMLAAGILGVILVSRPKPQPMARVPVRPVKTAVVGGAVPITQRKYPGKVQASQRVQMSFDVAGAIQELPVTNGQKVKKGEVLAKLDPRDYQNTLNARKAVENERRVNLDRTKEAFKNGVATPKEVDTATASYEVAKSETAIAQKALDDAVIHAPFDGVVAYTIAKQYQKVAAKEPVLSVQDISTLEIVINLPEQVIALSPNSSEGRTITASFDQLPGRDFPMKVKEYATEADPATQTYAVTLLMQVPKDATILPGMSATVTVATPPILTDSSQGYLLPLTAVPPDGQGRFHVWIVEPGKEGLSTVKRQDVSVGPMTKEYVIVTKGVSKGQRVVTAGANLLEDGQEVRMLGGGGS